jgi:hypothetical protein
MGDASETRGAFRAGVSLADVMIIYSIVSRHLPRECFLRNVVRVELYPARCLLGHCSILRKLGYDFFAMHCG